MNCMANKTLASMAKLLVTATHPNINGIAPGRAPTNTENEVLRFRGVYAKT